MKMTLYLQVLIHTLVKCMCDIHIIALTNTAYKYEFWLMLTLLLYFTEEYKSAEENTSGSYKNVVTE